MRILINSYTCCPGMGSEQGMGWNWIVNLARYCEVFVISEGEYKSQVEDFISLKVQELEGSDLPVDASERFAERMHFYWNPVPQSTRDKCWNQGNWSFYPLYAEWQKKTADMARDICKEYKIDILHQLNMIGFREPGFLADVSKETGIPLVWGPIGGLKMFPLEYAKDGGVKMFAFNWLKNTITKCQIKYDRRVRKTLKQASALVSSIPDSYMAIKQYHGLDSVIIPETGCNLDTLEVKSDKLIADNLSELRLIWAGKFDFRKRLDIALKALALVDRDVKLFVYGCGSHLQEQAMKELVNALNITNKVVFMGNCPNQEVKSAMQNADLFLFTSVSEDTSTVVLEAVSNNLPVLCFDACGMSAVINDKVGAKVPLTNPAQSVKDFAEQIRFFYDNREELSKRSDACSIRAQELSWDNKAKKMVEIYEGCLIRVMG